MKGRAWPVSALIVVISLLALSRAHSSPGEGILYYDRGHYWIVLILDVPAGGGNMGEFSREDFTVTDLAGGDSFHPSRVEFLGAKDGSAALVLSSGKFKGRTSYRIVYGPPGKDGKVIEPVRDPFHSPPAVENTFFRRYIAKAFARSGNYYSLDEFSCSYDFEAEKAVSEISVRPRFDLRVVSVSPAFKQDGTVYTGEAPGKRSAVRRDAGLTLSSFRWLGGLRTGIELQYEHERTKKGDGSQQTIVYSQSFNAAAEVRLDNLFDPVNGAIDRFCVFKGIDLTGGFAWHYSNDEDVWGSSDFRMRTPFLGGRITCTLLDGIQVSYSIESFFPSFPENSRLYFHDFRIRLLLRDALEPPEGKSFHPDLEFVYETGERLPLLEKEKRYSIGFTFNLFPWED